MISLKSLDYNKPLLLDDTDTQRIYIVKTFFKDIGVDQYFLKLYKKIKNGSVSNQGYMYFGVDFEEKISHFIGTYIKPEYRGNGYSSLLVSRWIQTCLENGINDLSTISKQRKPFILYLLKCFTFELDDISKYDRYGNNIYICSVSGDVKKDKKYLIFQNSEQKKAFQNCSIADGDSYHILDGFKPHVKLLDTVLLNTPYDVQDENEAYNRAIIRYNKFKNSNY